MALLRVWIVGVLLLVSGDVLLAQEAVTQETNPPSLKWYQLNTPNFNLLYPEGFEAQAQRMANTLETIHKPEAATMGAVPKKISIILQNQSSFSNAFVTMAPRRSEFYTMPTQDYNFVGNNDWLNLLASHEYRHVVQFQKSYTGGFNRLIYVVFGQQAVAGFAYVAVPQWLWEGDAVATETAFTHSGRGRIPNFDLQFRTNLLEGKVFNYHKQYLRSFKDNIPSHYVIGYHMVSYLRKKTGDAHVWEKIVKRAWGVPFVPFTFSNAIKKETGEYVTGLYREMAASLISQWKKEINELKLTSFTPVTVRSTKAYTDYRYPQIMQDGSVIAQKAGIGDIEQIVLVTKGGTRKEYVQGQMNATGMMSASGNKVVWNEFRIDPRWLVKTYSIVKGYDLEHRTMTVISRNSRYASAALSPDGTRVATVESGTDYLTRLVILDYATGRVLKELPNPSNDFLSMPRWTDDGKSIVVLRTNKTGKSVSRVNADTGTYVDLLTSRDENIGYPVPFHPYLFYNSPYSGIDNIYVLDTRTGKRFQVTSSRYASYNPAITADSATIYYNEQTRDGLDVVKIPFNPASWVPLENIKPGTAPYQHLVDQEGRPNLLDSVGTKPYVARRYRRISGMINPHSWGPYLTNTLTQAQLGIYSQDILSTTSINAGYLYDINERTGSWQGGISYQGFYPIIDFQVLSGTRTQKTSVADYDVKLNWHETGTTFGLRVPLVLTRSKYNSQIEIGNSVGVSQITSFHNKVSKGDTVVSEGNERYVPITIRDASGDPINVNYLLTDQVANGTLASNYFNFTWIHVLKQSRRDFNPKFGQYVYYENYSTPYGGDFSGKLWTIRGAAFFPGLFKHHSLYFQGGYQSSLSSSAQNTYTFRSRVFKPRGYSYPNDNTFSTISTNYKLPLWYPDIALGPVVNIQRIKANLFYDYGHGERTQYFYEVGTQNIYSFDQAVNYESAGVELTFDINVMRLLQPIELGVRATHIKANAINNSGTVIEFLIGNIPF